MTDTMVLPLAEKLLACLCDALAANPNPPLHCCLRAGDVVYADFNQIQDQCCEGFAYVRVARIYPSVEFPSQVELWTPCADVALAAELEMGVFRCEPQQDIELPSCDDWTATATQVANDWEAMVRAACCLDEELRVSNPGGNPVLMGVWQPLNSGGGCTGGMMSVNVGLMNCAC